MEDLRLYFGTYNVGTENPDQELYDLLELPRNVHKSELFNSAAAGGASPPDFYVLSFQEVKAQPQNLLLDALFEDPWTFACINVLGPLDYVKLKTIRLQGLVLNVFCLRKHLLNIRDMESEYTRTGLSGMWGNKGAVSIRLGIYGCSLCFVNSHLSAHDHHLKDRVDDYNSIVEEQKFHVAEHEKIFYHDYIFWMGDLNFRLLEHYERSAEEIEQLIVKNKLDELFAQDQLKYVIAKNEAFSELTESEPKFPPTFKFEVGTNRYDHKRRPAWCDRILYRVNTNNYEHVNLKAEQLSYKHHPFYTLSDHKPVTSRFNIKVFSDYSEQLVEFDNITSWDQSEENKASYTVSKEFPTPKEDWIGVFKENFQNLDEYVIYEYVSKCSTPTTTPSRNSQFASNGGGGSSSNDRLKYELSFSHLPSRCSGKYCLVYFSQSEDKVVSVLGISNAFTVVDDD